MVFGGCDRYLSLFFNDRRVGEQGHGSNVSLNRLRREEGDKHEKARVRHAQAGMEEWFEHGNVSLSPVRLMMKG
jgi:hypothetical protein